jgi:hypothetical protein
MPQQQLQLFTRAELTAMRDRTKSRSYSPEADEFRRVHERHRAWGLQQRHARKLRRLQGTAGSTADTGSRADASSNPSVKVASNYLSRDHNGRAGCNHSEAQIETIGNAHTGTVTDGDARSVSLTKTTGNVREGSRAETVERAREGSCAEAIERAREGSCAETIGDVHEGSCAETIGDAHEGSCAETIGDARAERRSGTRIQTGARSLHNVSDDGDTGRASHVAARPPSQCNRSVPRSRSSRPANQVLTFRRAPDTYSTSNLIQVAGAGRVGPISTGRAASCPAAPIRHWALDSGCGQLWTREPGMESAAWGRPQ